MTFLYLAEINDSLDDLVVVKSIKSVAVEVYASSLDAKVNALARSE